jgi:fatty acid synthase subunit alpha
VVHPRYLPGSLEPSVYEAYEARNLVRALQLHKAMSAVMITNPLVNVKDAPPYSPELEVPILMNSMARATLDVSTAAELCGSLIDAESLAIGVGVDQGESCSMTDSDRLSALRFRIDLICAFLEHHVRQS